MKNLLTKDPLANLSLLILTVILPFGCTLNDKVGKELPVFDLSEDIATQGVPVPHGTCGLVAWLDPTLLVLGYREDDDEYFQETSLILYDLETQNWEELPFEEPADCTVGRYRLGGRLPNDDLGFTYRCQLPANEGFQITLYRWERETGILEKLYNFSKGFDANEFSFAPNMSEWVQEENGDGINDELYFFDFNGTIEQLVPTFYRAGSPAWSPDSERIAFAATEENPETEGSIFSGLPGLRGAMYYPWNLYTVDGNGARLQVILSDVLTPQIIKWSPQGDLLAFLGEYLDKEGIWVLDLTGPRLVRVWRQKVAFEWSPSGQKLIILNRSADGESLLDMSAKILHVSELYSG